MSDILLGAIVFVCIPIMLLLFVWIVDGYEYRVIRAALIFIGTFALLNLMVAGYVTFVDEAVPHILGLAIFPLIALIIMRVVVQKLERSRYKRKRKNSS